jgi:hypothetical protein
MCSSHCYALRGHFCITVWSTFVDARWQAALNSSMKVFLVLTLS